jgi:hypothetical protein
MSTENKGWRKLRARIEESTTKQLKALHDRVGEGLTGTERALILQHARKIARKHAIKVERDRRRESEEPAHPIAKKIRDINKANRELNNKIAPVLERLTEIDAKRLLHPDGLAQLRTSAFHQVELQRAEQSARGKRRKGTRDPLKAAVIGTMRTWRKQGHTLDEYIEAAITGSVEGVTVKKVPSKRIDRYTVDCDNVSEGRRVAHKTLKEWWTEAGRA